ncbi:hypothetical protein FA13DRAFT_1895943 [Coprinellus micaceus]|uniref:F-box domain-containing protein n=1 Tax=Coprinellus micaceus TaxID=71717 RepID=A0A4Y7SVY1_COPMI|nr:hypothetical protein FA13DRAFT_1895943 [Coprinellus micaceus]
MLPGKLFSLESKLNEKRKDLSICHALSSPPSIRLLPSELLAIIFEFACDEDKLDVRNFVQRPEPVKFALLRVCKRWRDLTFRELKFRSQTVVIHQPGLSSKVDASFFDSTKKTCANLNRITDCYGRNLHHFHLEIAHKCSPGPLLDIILDRQAQWMRSLVLVNFNYPKRHWGLTMPALEQLAFIRRANAHIYARQGELFRFLSQLPSLTYLHLSNLKSSGWFCRGEISPPTTVFPLLKTLELYDHGLDLLSPREKESQSLPYISTPSLKTFASSFRSTRLGSVACLKPPFISSSYPSSSALILSPKSGRFYFRSLTLNATLSGSLAGFGKTYSSCPREGWLTGDAWCASKIAPENYSRGVTGPSSMKWGWDEGTRPSSDARKRIVFGVRVLTKHNGSSRAADAASLPHLIHGCGSPTSTHYVDRWPGIPTLKDSVAGEIAAGERKRGDSSTPGGEELEEGDAEHRSSDHTSKSTSGDGDGGLMSLSYALVRHQIRCFATPSWRKTCANSAGWAPAFG